MKRILYVLLALIFVFVLTACSNDMPATAGPNEGAQVASVDGGEVESVESDDSDDSASFSLDGEAIIPFGSYICYDRFSDERVSTHYIHVHDSNSSQVVFNYITNSGDFYELTANLDSSKKATVYLTDTRYLEMTFDQGSIYVDDFEGQGVMGYRFVH